MSNKGYKVIKVELNKAYVGKLLKSDAVMKCLESEAPKLGEIDSSFVGFDRCHVVIKKEN